MRTMVGTNTTRRRFLLVGLAAGLPLIAACASSAATPTAQTARASPSSAAPATEAATQGTPTPATRLPATAPAATPKATVQPSSPAPVTLTFWSWVQTWVDIQKPAFQSYSAKADSRVKDVEITVIPWGSYWTKLTAAIPAGQGPDFYQFHNQQHTDFISAGLLAPYPREIIDKVKDWDGVQQGSFTYIPTQKIYYLPMGTMVSALYVNSEIWDAAGLKDSDLPKTWDDLIPIAKELTKTNPRGEILQAGFGFNGNGWLIWNDMLYQQGQWQYDETGKKVLVDTPASRTALEYLLNLNNRYKVNSASFLKAGEGFGTKKIALTYSWLFATSYFQTNYKDLKFRVVPLPTFSGKLLPAYGRNNYEVMFAVNPKAPAEHIDQVWPLVDWFYQQGDVMAALAASDNVIPANPSLKQDKRVQSMPGANALIPAIPYSIFPGEFPPALQSLYARYIDQSYLQGQASLDATIKAIQEQGDHILGQKSYWLIERKYTHAAAFKSG